MTDAEGKVLPQCAAQIAVLEATGKQFSKSIGEMHQGLKENNNILQKQTISIATLATNVNTLTAKVDELTNTLDVRVNKAIIQKQKECIWNKVAEEKTQRDITKKFLKESNPPNDILAIEEEKSKALILKKIRGLPKKIQTAIYIGMTLAVIVGTIIGYIKVTAV